MQVEVNLPNKDSTLLPGAFVQVALPLPASAALVVPTNALLFRPDGIHVAVVEADGKVRLVPVQVGRNLGQDVEMLEGLSAAARVVLNPPDSLATGDAVTVVDDAPPGSRNGAKAAAASADAH
jgi:hypothetical protein